MYSMIRILVKILGFPSSFVYFFPRVYYENKKVQRRRIKGKALLISNHRGPLDFILMIKLFWWRNIRCVVSETVYDRNRFMRFWLKVFGSIRTDRFQYDLTFIGQTTAILNQGGVVEIYPEGRFVRDMEMDLFKPSYVYVALKANAPIIPVYNQSKYGFLKRTKVAIGVPIYLNDYVLDQTLPLEEINRLNQIVRNKVLELKGLIESETEKKHVQKNRK